MLCLDLLHSTRLPDNGFAMLGRSSFSPRAESRVPHRTRQIQLKKGNNQNFTKRRDYELWPPGIDIRRTGPRRRPPRANLAGSLFIFAVGVLAAAWTVIAAGWRGLPGATAVIALFGLPLVATSWGIYRQSYRNEKETKAQRAAFVEEEAKWVDSNLPASANNFSLDLPPEVELSGQPICFRGEDDLAPKYPSHALVKPGLVPQDKPPNGWSRTLVTHTCAGASGPRYRGSPVIAYLSLSPPDHDYIEKRYLVIRRILGLYEAHDDASGEVIGRGKTLTQCREQAQCWLDIKFEYDRVDAANDALNADADAFEDYRYDLDDWDCPRDL